MDSFESQEVMVTSSGDTSEDRQHSVKPTFSEMQDSGLKKQSTEPVRGDFDLLRKEDARLEKQIANLALIRLTFLTLLTFLFVSAALRRNGDAIAATREEITKYTLELQISTLNALDPITLFVSTPSWSDSGGELDRLTAQLQRQYLESLTVKFTAIGTDISVDLRIILLTAPIWVGIIHIYGAILREKRRMIRIAGHTLIERQQRTRPPILDLLYFGVEQGPFTSYPAVFVEQSFWLILFVLSGLTLYVMSLGQNSSLGGYSKIGLAFTLIYSFYLLLLTSYILRPFRRQLERELGCIVPADQFYAKWSVTRNWLISSRNWIKSNITIRTGGLLVLFSLALPTAVVNGCHSASNPPPRLFGVRQSPEIERSDSHEGESRPGYQLLNKHAEWPYELPVSILGGEVLYRTVLSLGCVAILVSFFSLKPSRSLQILSRMFFIFALAVSCSLLAGYLPFLLLILQIFKMSWFRFTLWLVQGSIRTIDIGARHTAQNAVAYRRTNTKRVAIDLRTVGDTTSASHHLCFMEVAGDSCPLFWRSSPYCRSIWLKSFIAPTPA
jgi:hypothetical protein